MDHTTEWLDDWQRVAPCQVSACQNLPRYLSKDYVGLESQITMIPWTHPSQLNPTQQILLVLFEIFLDQDCKYSRKELQK